MRELLKPPVFDDTEKTERARTLFSVAVGATVLIALVNGLTAFAAPALASRLALIAVAYAVASAALIALSRAGWVDEASGAWLVGVWAIATWTAWTGGGLSAPAISLQFLIVVLAGLLLGWRAALLAAVPGVLVMLAMWYAQAVGVLPVAEPRPPLFRALTLSGYVAVLALLSAFVMRGTERLRARVSREREEREAGERAREKEIAIRRAYVDVLDAVTGGKLVLMTPEEIESVLGRPVEGERDIASGGLAATIRWLRAGLLREFPDLSDPTALIDAAGEALGNAVKHAGGGTCQLYRRGDVAQFRVSDRGGGIDFAHLPKATLQVGYSSVGTLGIGFDMMMKYADRVLLSTQPGNTTIVLEMRERRADEGDRV